jgi:microcystin-dependent protein
MKNTLKTVGLMLLGFVMFTVLLSQAQNGLEISEDGSLRLKINGEFQDMQPFLNPVGTVNAYMGNSAPTGWFICDGTAKDKEEYAALYTIIGDKYGSTATTFNLPDLQGRFLRGHDVTSGRDEDRNSRSINGVTTGNILGSYQDDQIKNHQHRFTRPPWYGVERKGSTSIWGPGKATYSTIDGGTKYTGGSETRPENMTVNYIIKY